MSCVRNSNPKRSRKTAAMRRRFPQGRRRFSRHGSLRNRGSARAPRAIDQTMLRPKTKRISRNFGHFAIGHSKGRVKSGHFGTYPGHFGTQPRTLRRQTLSESVWRRPRLVELGTQQCLNAPVRASRWASNCSPAVPRPNDRGHTRVAATKAALFLRGS